MAGTKAGGIQARDKNLANDPDYYRNIGRVGGSKGAKDGAVKGFAANKELARRAGSLGGAKSKRPKKGEIYVSG